MVISLIRLKAHNYNPRWTTRILWSIGSSLNGNCHEEIIFRIRKIFNWSSVKFSPFPISHFGLRYDYRIKYFNLKSSRSQNSLALQDVQRLWIPFLVFDNTERNEATHVCDHPDHLTTLTTWPPWPTPYILRASSPKVPSNRQLFCIFCQKIDWECGNYQVWVQPFLPDFRTNSRSSRARCRGRRTRSWRWHGRATSLAAKTTTWRKSSSLTASSIGSHLSRLWIGTWHHRCTKLCPGVY